MSLGSDPAALDGEPERRPLTSVRLLLLLAMAGCVRSGPAAPAPGRLSLAAAIADGGELAGAQWGLLAVELATGDTLVSRNPALRFVPASTLKIATTIAALDLLGPGYRWSTELWAAGSIDSASAMLHGDLVIPGTGDPTLSQRWWPAEREPLSLLVAGTRNRGISHVTGTLVVDASHWDSTSVQESWMVGDLPLAFSATGGTFVIGEGETHVEVEGGNAPGDVPTVRWWPPGEDDFLASRLTTTDDTVLAVRASYLPESRRLVLTGTVPVGLVDTLSFATRDPVRQAAAALHRSLVAGGVSVEGGWRVAWEPGERFGLDCVTGMAPPCETGELLAALPSPTLLEVAEGSLGPSQNWIAEQILRTVGASVGERGGWDAATAAVRRYLVDSVELDSLDVRLVDGSGLSTQDLLTPRALVHLLGYARSRPWGDGYRAALAEPGEKGSTLEDRLQELKGRVFAKTGTQTNVAALAGYVIDEGGREIALAVLVNGSNLPAPRTRAAIDRIVRLVASGR